MKRPPMRVEEPDLVLTCHTSARRFAALYLVLVVLAALAVAAVWLERAPAVPRPVLVAAAVAAMLVALVHARLVSAATRYRIFRTSLELDRGLLSRRIDNLQLFRVRDLSLSQPLLGRLLGVGNVILTSTDVTTPRLVLAGVRDPRGVYDTLRRLVAASQATRQTMIVEEEAPPPRSRSAGPN